MVNIPPPSAQVVQEVLEEEKTIAQTASEFGIRPSLISD
jgi:transposase-like protein